MTDIPDPPTPPSPPDASAPACAQHPERPAATTCSHCGSFACSECDTIFEGRHICATCIDEGRVTAAAIPWAQRDQLGLVQAAWKTILLVSAEPGEFFDRVRNGRGDLSEAALFAFLVAIPAGVVGALYQAAIFGVMLSPGGPLTAGLDALGPEFAEGIAGASKGWFASTVTGVLLAPFATVAAQMAMGLVHHLVLRLTGAANREMEATLQGSMYALGINLWGIIPVLGFFVGFWIMVVQAIAYARIHQVTLGRPIAAVLSPLCVCCGGVGVIAVAMAIVMASIQ